MGIRRYIFLSTEGVTFQPNSESIEPDIENIQVVGFANGENSKEAFQNLIKENSYLLETTFDEIFSYELSEDYEKTKTFYYLSNTRKEESVVRTDTNSA
ncbi:MAG: hypothetical protein ABH868_01015 [bacterium]